MPAHRNLVLKTDVHEVYYTPYRSRVALSHQWLVIHHGICHTRDHFRRLIRSLNRLGFHVAMIEQFVVGRWLARNLVGMDRYRDGMKAAVEKIKADIVAMDPLAQIKGYVCHSMGAMICEETQHAHPHLRFPTIYMTPIPKEGAFPVSLRIIRRHPLRYAWAVCTLSVLSLLRPPTMARELLFDSRTDERMVRSAAKLLVPTSFFAYVQLTTRFLWRTPFLPWLPRPKIDNDDGKKMLFLSATDEIFYPWELKKTRRLYPQMQEEHFKGGHDFFIQYPRETANHIKAFFASKPLSAAPGVPTPAVPPPPQPASPPITSPDGSTRRTDLGHPSPPRPATDRTQEERDKSKTDEEERGEGKR
jgi:hypothetical protein